MGKLTLNWEEWNIYGGVVIVKDLRKSEKISSEHN